MVLNIPGGEFLTGSLDVISQSLTIPVLVILLVIVIISIISLGGLIAEYTSRRKVPVGTIRDLIYDINRAASVDDLKNVNGTIAIGDPESVPAGQYGKEVLTNLGIWNSVEPKLSLGNDVTAVLNQVAQGSADCGIVYATDAKSNDNVKVVCEAPEDALKTPVVYPVAEINGTKNPNATKAFLEFLQSQEAKDKFVEYGFNIHE